MLVNISDMSKTVAADEITTTISCTYGWYAGKGVLATLRETGEDVGYTRQEIVGSASDFRAAIDAAKKERETAAGTHRAALTRLIQRLERAA